MNNHNNLIISKCGCGKAVAPPRLICPKCGNKMKNIEIGNHGFVYSFTTLYSIPEGFSSPLNLVLVELENKAKVLCEYKGEKTLEIGDKAVVTQENGKYVFKI